MFQLVNQFNFRTLKTNKLKIITLILTLGLLFSFIFYSETQIIYKEVPQLLNEKISYMEQLMTIIEQSIQQQKKIIDITSFRCDAETFKQVMWLVIFNDPLNYLSVKNYFTLPYLDFNVGYIIMEYNEIEQIQKIKDQLTSIISNLDNTLNDENKVRWINNYICINYDYSDKPEAETITYLLNTGTGNCSAYTQLFSSLAKLAGLDVSFAISFKMQHVWNIVQIDGQWYNIDVTWNDDIIPYCYILSDKAMLLAHFSLRTIEDTIQFVKCESIYYDP